MPLHYTCVDSRRHRFLGMQAKVIISQPNYVETDLNRFMKDPDYGKCTVYDIIMLPMGNSVMTTILYSEFTLLKYSE
jgi:hypothetical protein